jgi:glucosamine--fructose-6-phosphate aminotransferase (isomerizing)
MNNFSLQKNHVHLVSEMLNTVNIIDEFDESAARGLSEELKDVENLMLTGEGSSRIFPARNALMKWLNYGKGPKIFTESATDLKGKDLSDFTVFGASNSGRTKEVVNLFKELKGNGHERVYSLTCTSGSVLEEHARKGVVLNTGKEQAVAATMTVMAQAFFYDVLLSGFTGMKIDKHLLAADIDATLSQSISQEILDTLARADHIFFAGIHNGVAEELTLKTNETVRKKSAYFPGTYLLHGVEEVISEKDVVLLVDYMPDHVDKIHKVFVDGIGAKVIGFDDVSSLFPSVTCQCSQPEHEPYVKLAGGWKVLAETGLAMGIDLDKPQRARKIGNEV